MKESQLEKQPGLNIYGILDQITEAFFALDAEWHFLYVNSLACQFLRRDRASLIGQSVWSEFPEAIGLKFDVEYRKAMDERVVVQFEEWFQPLDSWFEVRACPAENGLNVYFRDITSRKRMEEKIQQGNSILSHAQSIAEIGVWEWDIAKDIIHWSDGARRIGRYPRSTASFEFYINHLVHEKDREYIRKAIGKALREGPFDVEYRLSRPDGEIRIVQSHGQAVFDDAGEAVKMIGVSHDITNRKETEIRLREREEQYRSLVENSLNVIAVNDGEQWLYMNQAGLTVFEAAYVDDIIGKPLRQFLHADYYALYQERTNIVVSELRSVSLPEVKWYTLQGRVIETQVVALPTTFERRPVIQLIIRDVSERKQAEQLLIQSEKLSAVGQLAAAVAHEVRNPLTSLKGFLRLLRAEDGGARAQYFDIMEQEVSRIEMISSEMLMLAKPQAMSFGQQSVQPMLYSVITLLEPEAAMKGIQITADFEEVSPVLCVEHAMKQVFLNLIKNAIEAMPDGGTITIALREVANQVFVRVEDHGHGISQDLLAKLGEPFFTTKQNGTGLGLMVTRKIIENHQGNIQFSSQVGIGTTVTVTLPVSGSNDARFWGEFGIGRD